MLEHYEPPHAEVFNFIIFTFVGAVVGLTITKSKKFKKGPGYEIFTSVCLAFVVCICPAIICFHAALSYGSPDPQLRRILIIEASVATGYGGLMFGFGMVKVFSLQTRRTTLSNLHLALDWDWWWSNCAYGLNQTDLQVVPDFERQRNLGGWLWSVCMTWFTLRFVSLYLLYLPAIVVCNIIIAASSHPGFDGLNDTLFWLLVGSTVIITTLWLSTICVYQAYIHLLTVTHSVIICCFVSDNTYAPNILLAFLALYLSTLYDLINDDETLKNYHILSTWCFQLQAKFQGRRKAIYDDNPHKKCKCFGKGISWALREVWQCGQRKKWSDDFLKQEEREAIDFMVKEKRRKHALDKLGERLQGMQCSIPVRLYIDSVTDALFAGTSHPFDDPRSRYVTGILSADAVQPLEEMNELIVSASGMGPAELGCLGLPAPTPWPTPIIEFGPITLGKA